MLLQAQISIGHQSIEPAVQDDGIHRRATIIGGWPQWWIWQISERRSSYRCIVCSNKCFMQCIPTRLRSWRPTGRRTVLPEVPSAIGLPLVQQVSPLSNSIADGTSHSGNCPSGHRFLVSDDRPGCPQWVSRGYKRAGYVNFLAVPFIVAGHGLPGNSQVLKPCRKMSQCHHNKQQLQHFSNQSDDPSPWWVIKRTTVHYDSWVAHMSIDKREFGAQEPELETGPAETNKQYSNQGCTVWWEAHNNITE